MIRSKGVVFIVGSAEMERSLDLYEELKQYISGTRSDFELRQSGGVYFSFANTGRRGGGKKWFNIGLAEIIQTIEDIRKNLRVFMNHTRYDEDRWRQLGETYFTHDVAKSLITVQTKPFFTTLAKLCNWANDVPLMSYSDQLFKITSIILDTTIIKLKAMSANLTPDSISAATSQIILKDYQRLEAEQVDTIMLTEAFESALSKTGFVT